MSCYYQEKENYLREEKNVNLFQLECAYISAYRFKLENIVHPDVTYVCYGKIKSNGCYEWKDGHEFYNDENTRKDTILRYKLLFNGNGIKRVKGLLLGENGMMEMHKGYLAVNLHHNPHFFENMFKLSEFMNQDFFYYKSVNSENGWLVGTNGHNYPPLYGQKIECLVTNDGKKIFQLLSEYTNDLETLTHTHPLTRKGMFEKMTEAGGSIKLLPSKTIPIYL